MVEHRNGQHIRAARSAGAALALVVLAATAAGCAGTYPTVGDSLDAADRKLIVDATLSALESNKTGQGTNWENPASGHRGAITPTRTYETDAGTPCREFQQTAALDGRTYIAYDAACRVGGSWSSRHYDTLDGAIVSARPYRTSYADRYDYYYPYGYPYPYYGYRYPYYGYPYPYGYPYGSYFSFRFGHGHYRRHHYYY